MSTVLEPYASVDSFSADQISLLLRTIAEHKSHLDLAHEDARRMTRTGLRPAYLIDFDLLYMFMFEYDKHVNWAQEFQFLISNPNTQYIIGPGTQTELVRLQTRERPGRVSTTEIESRLPELARLLRSPNVIAYEELMGTMRVDEDAYELALATLDRSRRNRREDANQADALNWAAVVQIRRQLMHAGGAGFPYLLTGTEPLLREAVWDAGMGAPISRSPAAAIYAQVLFDVYPNPAQAMAHTVQAAFKAATAERDLRSSPAYAEPDRYLHHPDFERAFEQGLIGEPMREQLASMKDFVDDDVIYAAQRVYENVDLAAENVAQQKPSHVGRDLHSPRRLFDLIASLNAAMDMEDESSEGRTLSSLWNTVLDLQAREENDCLKFELRDRGGRPDKPPYFSVEVHPRAKTLPLFVMRWPAGKVATDVLSAFAASFARHSESTVNLLVGTSTDVLTFEADMPVLLEEIVDALADAGNDPSAGTDSNDLRWTRFNGRNFDLYADFAAEVPHDPVIGVFADSLHAAHLTELYRQSSARYLFAAWLQAALLEIAGVVELAHQRSEPKKDLQEN